MSRTVNPLRKALIALGLLVALTLLLQPLCNAYESAYQLDGGAACCLDMQPDALIAAPSTAGDKALAPALAVVQPMPRFTVRPAAGSGRLAVWKDPPPPSLPYHARSARIQR